MILSFLLCGIALPLLYAFDIATDPDGPLDFDFEATISSALVSLVAFGLLQSSAFWWFGFAIAVILNLLAIIIAIGKYLDRKEGKA